MDNLDGELWRLLLKFNTTAHKIKATQAAVKRKGPTRAICAGSRIQEEEPTNRGLWFCFLIVCRSPLMEWFCRPKEIHAIEKHTEHSNACKPVWPSLLLRPTSQQPRITTIAQRVAGDSSPASIVPTEYIVPPPNVPPPNALLRPALAVHVSSMDDDLIPSHLYISMHLATFHFSETPFLFF